MKKNTKQHYHDMMQVYNKMHEEVSQLAEQVLELNYLKHKLNREVLYEVNYMLGRHYCIVADLDWMPKLNNDKKFLEYCFMWLYDYLEDEEMCEAWYQYLDKKEALVADFQYHSKLYTNHILPL